MSNTLAQEEESTELIRVEELDPKALFACPDALEAVLVKINVAVEKHVPDATCDAGRKAIISLARKVASSKIILDNLGKEFTADLKAQTKKVDEVRKHIRDRLDALRDRTRQPVTDWENEQAERLRQERLADEYDKAWDQAHAEYDLRERERIVREKEAQLAKKEAEQRALEERARAERERQEREARIAAEATAKAKAEAERKEQARLAAEKAERDKQARLLANKKHRARIEREAVESLITSGCIDALTSHNDGVEPKLLATLLIDYIREGRVEHVAITY